MASPRNWTLRSRAAAPSPRSAAPIAAAFLSWWVLALCATYWGLKFFPASTVPMPPAAGYTAPAPADPVALARVFGPAQEPALASSEPVAVPAHTLVLQGVVANRSAQGVALIAVNGKPARPYRVGSRIEDRYVLRSVAARSAVVASDGHGAEMTLELAPPAPGTAAAPASSSAPPGSRNNPGFLRPATGAASAAPQSAS